MSKPCDYQELYNAIPTFRCKPGCHDCCGPVPFSKWEWDSVADKRKGNANLTCPYVNEQGRCDIYDQRPFLWRIFGATDDPMLRCPHGCGPDKPLSAQEANELTDRYIELMKSEDGDGRRNVDDRR